MRQEKHFETLSQQRRQRIRQGDDDRISPVPAARDADTIGATADVPRVGKLIDGRFRLLERLGSGRLGEIYEARVDAWPVTDLERRVALQVFDRGITADLAFIDKVRRGYAALRAGPHRNIVRLEALGRDYRTWYLVMERLQGASLRFVLDDVGPLPLDEAMAIARSVGDALSYLHAKEMVHGALSPHSVFVTEDYEVKLLDVVPAFPAAPLPPEIGLPAGAELVATRSDDIYGLACLTYELLTGRHPYNYATAVETQRQRLAPPAIAQLPAPRWQALARGLSPDCSSRPSSVLMFLKELGVSGSERLIGPEPPTAAAVAPARVAAGIVAWSDESPIVTTPRDRLSGAEPVRVSGRSRWLRRMLVMAALAAAVTAAWVYQAPLRDLAVDQLAAFGINFMVGESADADRNANDGARDNVAEASRDGFSGVAGDEVGLLNLPTVQSDPGVEPEVAGESEISLDSDEPIGLVVAPETQVPVEPVTSNATELAVTPPSEPESRFVLEQSVIRVSESDNAAAITVRREGGIASQRRFVWWTSDDTARAGEDYADLGVQAEEFDEGIERLTFYVPIINDSLSESSERFLVQIGRETAPGRVALIAGTSVEILDDDASLR